MSDHNPILLISSDEDEPVPEKIAKREPLSDVHQTSSNKPTSILSYFSYKSVSKKRKISEESIEEVVQIDSISTSNIETNNSPYYLNNFWLIVDTVVGSHGQLALANNIFNDHDRAILHSLLNSSLEAQRLFVRLFQRQKQWIPRSKMNYTEEFPNMNSLLTNLVNRKLISDSIDKVDKAIFVLSAPQVKQFSSYFKLFPEDTKAKFFTQKNALVSHLMDLKYKLGEEIWRKKEVRFVAKCRELSGPCYCIEKHVRQVFLRSLFIFSRVTDLQLQQQQKDNSLLTQVYSLLNVQNGSLKFPTVVLDESKVLGAFDKIYTNPEELDNVIWFYLKMEKLQVLSEGKKWKEALELSDKIEKKYKALSELDSGNKLFKRFQWQTFAKKALFQCSDIYEKNRDYKKAVEILQLILNSNPGFANGIRGKVWLRLILDFNRHLKQSQMALNMALEALQDPTVGRNIKLDIEDKIYNDLWKKVHGKNYDVEFERSIILEVWDSRIINAFKMSYEFDNVKTKFYRSNNKGDGLEICSVEEAALDFYVDELGFQEGIHAEGSSIGTLLGILFWDIIFCPNINTDEPVFLTKYQSAPLDFFSGPLFYERRQEQFESCFELIEKQGIDFVTELLTKHWSDNEEVYGQPVNWNTFENVEQLLRFSKALGTTKIISLARRLFSDYSFYHSGFPDLTIWNESKVCFVEVKGPGDSLSAKQKLWLDFFKRNNIDAELCRVEAAKSRKLS